MHSSMMRTVHCSSRLLGGGVSAKGGVSVQGGVCQRVSGGCLPRRGGGVCWGVSARGGVSQHALRQIPPPVDRILDTHL